MKFNESGLPNSKIIEDAFDYAHDYIMSFERQSVKVFEQQVEVIRKEKIAELEKKRDAGELSDYKFMEAKKDLNHALDEQKKSSSEIIRDTLEKRFEQMIVKKAQILSKHSSVNSDELIAASLLIESSVSPINLNEVRKKFGEEVYMLVDDIVSAELRYGSTEVSMRAATSDVQRIYMASVISRIEESKERAAELKNKGKDLPLEDEQEQSFFESAKIVWGNDSKLDKCFVKTFNDYAQFIGSAYRASIDDKGGLSMQYRSALKNSNDNLVNGSSNNKRGKPKTGDFKF